MTDAIRLATRRSQLALTQARGVAARISALAGRPVTLVEVVSEGDVRAEPLRSIGGAGVFVAAVRQVVADGSADLAVHSLKDLPTAPAPGLELLAVPPRADARDALCAVGGGDLGGLPVGARVGTGSPRRAAQLAALRPDLEVADIRGNIDTRLARVGADLDAVVLATAGLARIGRADAGLPIDPEIMLPAPGQGALAIEGPVPADAALARALADLDDPATRAAVTAERALLAALEAGCSAPVGAFAEAYEPGYWEPEIFLRGGVFGAAQAVRMSITGPAASAAGLGRELAARMLAAGAAELMRERI